MATEKEITRARVENAFENAMTDSYEPHRSQIESVWDVFITYADQVEADFKAREFELERKVAQLHCANEYIIRLNARLGEGVVSSGEN